MTCLILCTLTPSSLIQSARYPAAQILCRLGQPRCVLLHHQHHQRPNIAVGKLLPHQRLTHICLIRLYPLLCWLPCLPSTVSLVRSIVPHQAGQAPSACASSQAPSTGHLARLPRLGGVLLTVHAAGRAGTCAAVLDCAVAWVSDDLLPGMAGHVGSNAQLVQGEFDSCVHCAVYAQGGWFMGSEC